MFELEVDDKEYEEINEENKRKESELIGKIYRFTKNYMDFLGKKRLKYKDVKIKLRSSDTYKEVKIYKRGRLLFKITYGYVYHMTTGYRPHENVFFDGYIDYDKIFELENILQELKADYESEIYDSYKKELEKKEVLISMRDMLQSMEAI